MKYERIIRAISDECWAILPSKLEEIIGVVEARARGVVALPADIAEIEARRRRPVKNGRVGVLPLLGAISQRADAVTSSLGTSAEAFGKAFDGLMDDPAVGGVLMDVDSPGGSVRGIPELASKIRSRRGEKPIVAVANGMAASAAFWVASAADELVVTPSGDVGSVGVIAAHVDQSGFDEKMGLKTTFITSARFKAEGNPHEPMSNEALAFHQARVNEFHSMFVRDLAKNRDTTEARVNRDFGEGRLMSAKAAVENNLADRIATFEQVLSEMTGQTRPNRTAAMAKRFALT